MLRPIALVCAWWLGAGCTASQPQAPATAVAAVQNCVRETPLGSSIPVTRCRSAEDLAREAQAKQAVEEAISRGRSAPGSGVPKN